MAHNAGMPAYDFKPALTRVIEPLEDLGLSWRR
jgi:hypothetical protein